MRQPAPQRAWRWLLDLLKPARRHELTMLVLAGVVAGLLWAFVELAEDVVQGEPRDPLAATAEPVENVSQ